MLCDKRGHAKNAEVYNRKLGFGEKGAVFRDYPDPKINTNESERAREKERKLYLHISGIGSKSFKAVGELHVNNNDNKNGKQLKNASNTRMRLCKINFSLRAYK